MSMSFRDYTVIVFFYTGQPKKWIGIRNLGEFINSLDKENEGWKYINVYDYRDKNFLKRLYRGNVKERDLSVIFRG